MQRRRPPTHLAGFTSHRPPTPTPTPTTFPRRPSPRRAWTSRRRCWRVRGWARRRTCQSVSSPGREGAGCQGWVRPPRSAGPRPVWGASQLSLDCHLWQGKEEARVWQPAAICAPGWQPGLHTHTLTHHLTTPSRGLLQPSCRRRPASAWRRPARRPTWCSSPAWRRC